MSISSCRHDLISNIDFVMVDILAQSDLRDGGRLVARADEALLDCHRIQASNEVLPFCQDSAMKGLGKDVHLGASVKTDGHEVTSVSRWSDQLLRGILGEEDEQA